MTTTLVQLDLKTAAKEAAGNWRTFGSNFSWYRKYDLESPEDWAIFYTHHRDSDLLELSNAEVITEAMQPFSEGDNPDVVFESHDSWAVGHVDGLSVLVFRRGRITKAFRTYHELSLRLADYPSMLGLPSRTVSEVTEPFLVRVGLIIKDDQGRRQLTQKGMDHVSNS